MQKHRNNRINLILPDALSEELERLSNELEVSQVVLARHLLKFSIHALRISLQPGGGVFIREPDGQLEKVGLRYL